MTRDQIKELIKQSTNEVWGNNQYNGAPEFEGSELDVQKFAALVADATREEDAKVCENPLMYLAQDRYQTAANCAAAIRSRK